MPQPETGVRAKPGFRRRGLRAYCGSDMHPLGMTKPPPRPDLILGHEVPGTHHWRRGSGGIRVHDQSAFVTVASAGL